MPTWQRVVSSSPFLGHKTERSKWSMIKIVLFWYCDPGTDYSYIVRPQASLWQVSQLYSPLDCSLSTQSTIPALRTN